MLCLQWQSHRYGYQTDSRHAEDDGSLGCQVHELSVLPSKVRTFHHNPPIPIRHSHAQVYCPVSDLHDQKAEKGGMHPFDRTYRSASPKHNYHICSHADMHPEAFLPSIPSSEQGILLAPFEWYQQTVHSLDTEHAEDKERKRIPTPQKSVDTPQHGLPGL